MIEWIIWILTTIFLMYVTGRLTYKWGGECAADEKEKELEAKYKYEQRLAITAAPECLHYGWAKWEPRTIRLPNRLGWHIIPQRGQVRVCADCGVEEQRIVS